MELLITFLVIFIVGSFLIKFSRLFSSSIPEVRVDEIQKFKENLPPGFAYAYYMDKIGFAINVEADTILLADGNSHSLKHDSKIYDRSQLRKISGGMKGWEYWRDGRPLAALDNAVAKREAKYDAYRESGIFVKVADIDHPTWQIRFSSETLLERNFEILSQFMEGILPAPASEVNKN